jgi:hypothetical protein
LGTTSAIPITTCNGCPPRQQLLPKAVFQVAKLRADRRRRQAQLLAGAPYAAGLHDSPKVKKVMVVNPFHSVTHLSVAFLSIRENRTLAACIICFLNGSEKEKMIVGTNHNSI